MVSKFLGVKTDQNLNWDDHIQMISKKAASGISATLLTIYRVLVQPHVNHCSAVWGNCNKSLSQKIPRTLENRAARFFKLRCWPG